MQLRLPQAASLPPLGVYRGPLGIRKQDGVAGTAGQGISAYETFIGRSVTYALDYLWNTPSSTSKFTGGELAASNNAGSDAGTAASGWTGHLGGRTLMLAIPACIHASAGAGAATWAQEASGTSDTYWTTLGNNLISWGLGSSVLRIGREFNYSGYTWSPSTTGDTAAQYIAGYQHIVTLLRGLSGANFTFMWNPALDPSEAALSQRPVLLSGQRLRRLDRPGRLRLERLLDDQRQLRAEPGRAAGQLGMEPHQHAGPGPMGILRAGVQQAARVP